MAFSELELKRIDKTLGSMRRRLSRPEHADKLRFVFEVDGHAVSIYEERSPWDGAGEWTRSGVARFRHTRTRGSWTLYWMRRDLKWHAYDPDAMPGDLESLVALVNEDRYGAFFG
jgi:hypothetical protein